MGELPVELHPEAEEEYLSSLSWYRERSLSAAENFERVFDRAFKKSQTRLSAGRFIFLAFESTHSTSSLSSLCIEKSLRGYLYWRWRMGDEGLDIGRLGRDG